MNSAAIPEALVLDAGGTVGFGVVGALLEVGSPVLAIGREGPRISALAEHFADEPALALMKSGCLCHERDGERLAQRVGKRARPLRAVFASLASPLENGRLLDQPVDILRRKLEMDLLPHLIAARHLLPLLARSAEQAGVTAHYILMGGPHAERGWAGYGHASVSAAALRMLSQVLHEEALALGVRVQLLSVDQPICTPANAINACSEWPSALAVGRRAVALMQPDGKPAQAIVRFSTQDAREPSRLLFNTFPELPGDEPGKPPGHSMLA